MRNESAAPPAPPSVGADRVFTTPEAAALEAVHHILVSRGADLRLDALAIDGGEAASPDSLARLLERHGQSARVVQVAWRELNLLHLPTLAFLHSGAAVVVSAVNRRNVTLTAQNGERQTLSGDDFARRYSGSTIDLTPPMAAEGPFIHRVVQLLLRERQRFVRPVLASIYAVALGLLSPLLTRALMDRAIPDGDRSLLWAIVIGTLAVALQSAWLGLLRETALIAAGGAFELASQRTLYAQLVRLPFLRAQARSVGAFTEALASGSEIARSAATLLPALLLDCASALAHLWMLAFVLPPAAALGLGAGLLMVGVSWMCAPRLQELERTRIDAAGVQFTSLHELLSGNATLKTCGAERQRVAHWISRMVAERSIAIRQSRLEQWLGLFFAATRQGIMLAVFVWGGRACLNGELSVGTFVAAAMLAESFLEAMFRLTGTVVPWFSVRGRTRQIDEVLPARTSASASLHHGLPSTRDAIRLRNVWFRYTPDGPWILQDYNLDLARGETLVLRGASGMGKTTVLRLIAGLLTPERGEVQVFGRSPAPSTGHVAYLPQDANLFEGSLLSNLRLLSGASHARILAAIRVTGLAPLIGSLPMGLETLLPPGGSTLSGGQRQLVLMTAAVASERPILLLDESLANLDHQIRRELRGRDLFAGKTVLAVAHD